MTDLTEFSDEELYEELRGEKYTVFDNEAVVTGLIESLCSKWFGSCKSVYMAGVDGAPDWLEYEHNIWSLGEALRPLLKKKKKWQGPSAIMDSVSSVLANREYGKGRQTFALLLGDYGKGGFGDVLSEQLDDESVAGHCVKALLKAKIKGYEQNVRVVFDKSDGWTKKAAKKYLTLQ